MTAETVRTLALEQFADFRKLRSRYAHKGEFGHVLIVGGDYGYSGSVRMAAEAALRVGAGLVSVATRPEHALLANSLRPEIMCWGITADSDLIPLLNNATVVVAGPGLGRGAWGQQLLALILKCEKQSLIIDADGLTILAENPQQKSNWILTPHPGEAARLLKTTVSDIQGNRLKSVELLQRQYGGVCVLKGAGTLVMGPGDSVPAICMAGNPGMATAGTGDVLSGVIGGLLAQALPLTAAASLGVLVHAMAGDLAAKEGERGMIATDLIPHLRELVNS